MSFHQNTSNQWAPQEQSEPAANSSPAPRGTGAPTNAQSVGNAASLGVQIESNTSNFNELNNDGNSDLRSRGLVSSFSIEESSHEDWSNPNGDPWVRSYLSALYFGKNPKLLYKFDKIKLLKRCIEKSSELVQSGVQTPAVHVITLIAALKAQEFIIRFIAGELPKHGYCPHFKGNFETVIQHINTSIGYIGENVFQNEKDVRDIEATVASIQRNIEIIKAWDSRQSFLCGQSEKFANVVCAKDLLPQNDGPTTCGVCLSTIKETSDFAVQSDCPHIFCTSCLTTWFKTKENCPMCRQSGLFMSKDRLLELRSSGPELTH